MKLVDGRTLDHNKAVEIYWNLHRHTFSVRQGGLVVAYTDRFFLLTQEFKVSEAGRQRVLATKRKTVHAVLVGVLLPYGNQWDFSGRESSWAPVTYNPYKYDSFVAKTPTGLRRLGKTAVPVVAETVAGQVKRPQMWGYRGEPLESAPLYEEVSSAA